MTEVKLGKDAITLPVGTEAGRPANPVTGMIRWNTDTDALEGYNGVEWAPISSVPISATGGTVSDVTIDGVDYRIHEFTSTGTSSFEVISLGTTNGEMDVLVVAGGGGTGYNGTGGGGSGGVVFVSGHTAAPSNHTVTVGNGGNNNPNTSDGSFGTNGDDSSVFGFTALGGGTAGLKDLSDGSGRDGGSGGGAGRDYSFAAGGSGLQPGENPSADNDAGNDGGAQLISSASIGAGGGGAGEPAPDADGDCRDQSGGLVALGRGGDGLDFSSIFTTNYGDNGFFGGGGGGGAWSGCSNVGAGGAGGGGHGGNQGNGFAPEPGQNNTGGGGGGAGNNESGSTGGSGIVLIRYRI